MKKFIIILIILIIISGTGLYFGWVSINPGYYGIAFSSITGIENYPLEAGKFYWFWQKLIPKHFKVYLIKNTPTVINFSFSATLPGSEDLKDFGNFNIGIDGKIKYTIDYKAATILISKGIIEEQENYFKNLLQNSIQHSVSNFILEIFEEFNSGNKQIDYSVLERLKEKIKKDIIGELSTYGIHNFKLDISYNSIPQIDIYTRALQLYVNYINELYQSKEEELKRKAEATIKYEKDKAELKHLEDIGILVEKYPNLLKYMYIEKLGDKIHVVVLPEGKSGFPSITESETPEITTGKKNFIPIPGLPEENLEKNLPSTPELKEKTPENSGTSESVLETEKNNLSSKITKKSAESSISPSPKEKKWYDYLKFWEIIGKKNKQ